MPRARHARELGVSTVSSRPEVPRHVADDAREHGPAMSRPRTRRGRRRLTVVAPDVFGGEGGTTATAGAWWFTGGGVRSRRQGVGHRCDELPVCKRQGVSGTAATTGGSVVADERSGGTAASGSAARRSAATAMSISVAVWNRSARIWPLPSRRTRRSRRRPRRTCSGPGPVGSGAAPGRRRVGAEGVRAQ